ncbi:alpha-amylase family glycosyl hydrolase [Shewanella sp. KJ10-1]|uniref:Alpha-amylase family glycosyl hydrolase n=1 Tax=Shewanella phaeophyticola TaxID=2978345 RepID=A0ABT2P217_9GAMM|nr:alpha-amylase family glycosyl hydrolase [Shewanella sp. KJ10-1]
MRGTLDHHFVDEIPITPLQTPLYKSVLFETHIKGFTKQHPLVDTAKQGTFAGLSSQAVIDYLQELGVTGVELLPVHGFFDEPFLTEKGLNNYWGYNSIAFMAPHSGYLANKNGDIAEFRHMVSRLHHAGIEVILDVVFNHTAEGNHLGFHIQFSWHR